MPFSRNSDSGGRFASLKSKLGFGNRDDGYDDYGYDDGYGDDYDTYSDNFDDYSTYDEEQEARDREMDRYGEVVERDASARRSRRSYTDAASFDLDERRHGASHTPLLSIEDIRANTPRPSTDAPAGAHSSSLTRHEFRSSDYMASGSLEKEFIPDQAGDGSSRRSSGYDSLFSSTTSSASSGEGAVAETSGGYSSSFAPSSVTSRRTRNLVVIAPKDYSEVEKVSSTLKTGDVAILNLKSVPSDLSKRVLDFSFGVASALDSNVDCIDDKVFALTRYTQLSDAERIRLRGMGVISQ